MIESSQCRAARALLEWTQPDLAQATGLSVVTIRAFEKGGEMRDSNRNLVRLTFERAGVEFIPENGGGPGVRLRKGGKPHADHPKPAGPATDAVDAMDAAIDEHRRGRPKKGETDG